MPGEERTSLWAVAYQYTRRLATSPRYHRHDRGNYRARLDSLSSTASTRRKKREGGVGARGRKGRYRGMSHSGWASSVASYQDQSQRMEDSSLDLLQGR